MFLFKVLLLPEIEKEKEKRLKAKREKLFVTYQVSMVKNEWKISLPYKQDFSHHFLENILFWYLRKFFKNRFIIKYNYILFSLLLSPSNPSNISLNKWFFFEYQSPLQKEMQKYINTICWVHFCCLFVYDFRADHLVLDNHLRGSSLKQKNSPKQNIHSLHPLICLVLVHLFLLSSFVFSESGSHVAQHSQPETPIPPPCTSQVLVLQALPYLLDIFLKVGHDPLNWFYKPEIAPNPKYKKESMFSFLCFQFLLFQLLLPALQMERIFLF